jgi:DNA-nicking Smr family endonuclease
MNFFQNILDSVKRKSAELKERKEFLDMVEGKARPIRRKAYMEQMLKEVVQEGIEKAKQDAAKKSNKTKQPSDFGMMEGINDPYRYLKKGDKK